LRLSFTYAIRNGLAPNKFINTNPVNYQTWYGNKLPIVFNPEAYGNIINKINNTFIIKVTNKIDIHLKQLVRNNIKFNTVKYFKNGKLMFDWTDTQTNPNIPNSFRREIGKSTYHYENGILVLSQMKKETKAIERSMPDNRLINNFITMDLETISPADNNILEPYLLSWYDGMYKKSYFITDFKDFKDLLSKVFDDLIYYNNYSIYFHNFAKFDSYFILKYLPELGHVDPIIHKDKLITLNFTRILEGNKILKLTFKDSYLLLPSSLKNLSKSFNIESPKGIFPYLLTNINYKGNVPSINYFTNLTQDEYESYKNSFNLREWNFRTEAIKYCELDCKALYQVLFNFSRLIFKKFNINIHNCPTTPSLAFKIFRTRFLPKGTIHNITGKIERDIRLSYTGGAVDMYLPTNDLKQEKIYAYDVNSLYPSVMKNFDIPIGSPTEFMGDIRKVDKNAFGFFYCEIEAPQDLIHPIIQTHIKTSNGIRTVAPLGNWSDMVFSEEMDNAIKYGYKFNIKWGYTFNRKNVFKNYIDTLYKLRLEYPKTDPMNYIAKLLLNSLYGRFGMDDNFMLNDVLHKVDADKFIELNPENVKNLIELGDYIIVQSQQVKDEETDDNNNVNIAVASAITAYARIHMSQFKNNSNYKLFYSDTDSIYINKPLDDSFISNTVLGKMKLENIIKKGIFLAPKVYGLQTEEGKIIILLVKQ